MSADTSAAHEVVKPARTAWRSGPLLLGVLFAVAVAVNFDPDDLGPAVMLAVAALVVVGGVVVVLLRTRLEIGPGVVVRHGVRGSTRVTRDDVDRVTWIPALQAGQAGRVQSRLVVVDRSGGAALRLTTPTWSPATLVRVAEAVATKDRFVHLDQPTTLVEAAFREPEVLSWGERHPFRVVALALFGTLAVLALLFGVFVLTS